MKRGVACRLAPFVAVAIAFACGAGATRAAAETYFDAHNHFTGILPYYAYADLPAFIARISESSDAVSSDDRLALYRYIADVWYPRHRGELGNRLFSPADGQRYSLGARAALVVYHDRVAGSVSALDGALERILTATPWTEFDSAYAFRGGPAYDYLKERFYSGSDDALETDLCRATILDLAATNIDVSEQSLPFIGGWGLQNGRSTKLNTIECAMDAASDRHVNAGLQSMGKPLPVVTFVLMTHTSQLATLPGGSQYSEWSKTGTCAPVTLPPALQTSPSTIYHALLGQDDSGNAVIGAERRQAFFQSVVGIDTAGPETTCFTPDGMAYYEQLVQAVYDASKMRRSEGWNGKLLVHTHVGEGGTIDYAPVPPAQPWTFSNAFASLPTTLTNAGQAASNISTLLVAIAAFERNHPDAVNYVVFRLAHDTWANDAQAGAMHDEGVEADVSLESSVVTGAYPISRMPLGQTAVMGQLVSPLLAGEGTNFELNDLPRMLISNPDDELGVGEILGNASLKYLLERRVRCLLGTDAAGVEHSDIVKEYEYAGALIGFWNRTDPVFRSLAANVTQRTLFDDVRWHLTDMSTDSALPY
jgi:hypothetical protein